MTLTEKSRMDSASTSCEPEEMPFVLSNVVVCWNLEMGNHGQLADSISDQPTKLLVTS
jgi:hypothetical protein